MILVLAKAVQLGLAILVTLLLIPDFSVIEKQGRQREQSR
jgi:hypothetical protein